jgi:hypothetical protein
MDEGDESDNSSSSLLGGLDLSWLSIPGVDIEAISLHQGMSDLKFADGKFTGTSDGTNGLTKLQARFLGVHAKYDAEEGTGSLEGNVGKKVDRSMPPIHFPLGVPGISGHLSMGGYIGFDAGLKGRFAKNKDKSTESLTYMLLSGSMSAEAYAGITLTVGASLGIPYLATLDADLIGSVGGKIKGTAGLEGGAFYNNEIGKMSKDPENAAKGNFDLIGQLTAAITGSIKGRALVFEHEIASVELGQWVLGEYKFKGTITTNEEGMPEFNIDDSSGFMKEPTPPDMEPKPIPIKTWLTEHEISNKKIEYSSDSTKNVTLVARNILYGAYNDEEKSELKLKYIGLLKNGSDQDLFTEKYTSMSSSMSQTSGNSSFMWTSELWDQAVDRRTVLFFFEQSKSKATISDLLKKYHKNDKSNYSGRFAILDEILEVIDNYINHRSKVPSNKREAKQLENQIALEKETINIEKKKG